MTIFLYTHTEEFCNKDILYFNKIKIPLPAKNTNLNILIDKKIIYNPLKYIFIYILVTF